MVGVYEPAVWLLRGERVVIASRLVMRDEYAGEVAEAVMHQDCWDGGA